MWSAEEIECMIPRAGEFIGSVRYKFIEGTTLEWSYFEYEGEFFCHKLWQNDANDVNEEYFQVSWEDVPTVFM